MPIILLVDDVQQCLEVEKKFLKPSRARVLTARDGVEALAVIRQERPDLVIMDQQMPKMDGLACCTAIKGDPSLRAIQVILTGNAGASESEDVIRRSGCDDYLEKPVSARTFLEKVSRFVPGIERRLARIPCRVPVTVRLNGSEMTCVSEDLSVHGMYVACQTEVQLGSTVDLIFTLPGGNSRIEVQGRVDWVNSPEDRHRPSVPAGFGVEFTLITGEGLALLREKELREYLEKQMPDL